MIAWAGYDQLMSKSALISFKDYRAHLQAEEAKIEDPVNGFFGPTSMAWRLNGEVVLGLIVIRAILMQVSHPKVAQGVAEHSNFREQAFTRAIATLKAQQQIVFGTCAESRQALERIYARHVTVEGELDGEVYGANDPELLFWVFATLIDSMHYAYRTFLPDLSHDQWDSFYLESRFFAKLMGIPEHLIPESRSEFEHWMTKKMASGEIRVSAAGREVGRSLLSSVTRLAWPITSVFAAGSLPPELRSGFGLSWGATRDRIYKLGARLIRTGIRWLPRVLHTSPNYWRAMHRARLANS